MRRRDLAPTRQAEPDYTLYRRDRANHGRVSALRPGGTVKHKRRIGQAAARFPRTRSFQAFFSRPSSRRLLWRSCRRMASISSAAPFAALAARRNVPKIPAHSRLAGPGVRKTPARRRAAAGLQPLAVSAQHTAPNALGTTDLVRRKRDKIRLFHCPYIKKRKIFAERPGSHRTWQAGLPDSWTIRANSATGWRRRSRYWLKRIKRHQSGGGPVGQQFRCR